MHIKSPYGSLKLLTISAYIVVCLSTSTKAQEYSFDIWTTANGLPQNTVTGVAQTPDGYLWVSTFDGLARFDGVRFKIFDTSNTEGMLNDRFAALFVDREGAIWAAAENGVITIYRNGVFTSYQDPEKFGFSCAIVSDEKGDALIESGDGFYYLQDGRLIPTGDQKEKNIRQAYFKKSGSKWIFRQGRISRQKDGHITNYPISLPPDQWGIVNTLRTFEDRQGALWFALNDKLYHLPNGNVSVFTKKEIPALNELALQLTFEDAEGSFWFLFGPSNFAQKLAGQLVRFKDNRFTSYNLGKPVIATSGIVDREGNFWLATQIGLVRLRQQLVTSLSMKDGLISNEVYPLLQTNKGEIFIGTILGVNRYADGKITNLGLQKPNNSPLYMRGLWEDYWGRVWLGYQGEGGFGRFEEPSFVKRIGKNNLPTGATDFASDREGNIWIATEEGLFKYRDDREIAHYTIKDGLRNDKIITLHFDRNGHLWLGTFDGLSQFKDGRFISYNADPDCPKGFVRTIYEDVDGVLWFGTYGDGLVRYKDGKFFNYRLEHGLANKGVFAILEDERGNFWMSSNRGIHRISRQELNDFADGKTLKLNFFSYDERDGMLNAECNGGRLPAAIKTKDGKFWFSTMGGVAIIDPEAEKINPNPPPVVIENISIDRKPVDLKASQSAIELLPGQSNIAIEYTGLSLIKSEQIKFRYKLEGLEEDWIDAGTKRTVDYSYLPAGTYTFRLIAANANGIWNNEGASIKVIVHPYFYQTLWFRFLISVAIALVIGLIYHTRVSRLRAIAETKTVFSRQLIKSQEAERKRIASELHDGLGQTLVVIKTRAMFGINEDGDKERVAEEFGAISESASQALDEMREITNNLRPQLLDRLGLTKAIESMLKKVSDVVEIESEIDSIDNIFNENEEINIYRVVQESLNNVVKHSKATRVAVKIKRTENSVLISIQDNGEGFMVESAESKGSLGLIGLKERSQLLNGELRIDSEIERGTNIEVKIQLPK